MRAVFADTVYWIAVARPNDQFTQRAKQARASLINPHILGPE